MASILYTMSSDANKSWFSAYELALFGKARIINIPRSERRAGEKARNLGWSERQVLAKGGRGGVKTEYQPTEDILDIIHKFLDENPVFFHEEKESEAAPQQPAISNGFVVQEKRTADYKTAIYIEHYLDVRGAAGAGQITPTDQMIINVAVNAAEWRKYVGLNPKHIKVITVYGDSMRPTLQHGDQVLVDTACNRFVDDAIYAIQQGDMLRIKRIKLKLDGSIEVKSDNDYGFGTEVYGKEDAAAFKVVGRVLPFKFGKFDL